MKQASLTVLTVTTKYFASRNRSTYSTHGHCSRSTAIMVERLMYDPRDAAESKHKRFPDIYWSNLGVWKRLQRIAGRISRYSRFLIVRYEQLVKGPNRLRCMIMDKMPILRKRANFSSFHAPAKPDQRALRALRSVRSINTNNIASWRLHKPLLEAQIRLHGAIEDKLIRLGYGIDRHWLRELNGIEPDNCQSCLPDRISAVTRIKPDISRYMSLARYALGAIKQPLTPYSAYS
jgi:hypothetical protein